MFAVLRLMWGMWDPDTSQPTNMTSNSRDSQVWGIFYNSKFFSSIKNWNIKEFSKNSLVGPKVKWNTQNNLMCSCAFWPRVLLTFQWLRKGWPSGHPISSIDDKTGVLQVTVREACSSVRAHGFYTCCRSSLRLPTSPEWRTDLPLPSRHREDYRGKARL